MTHHSKKHRLRAVFLQPEAHGPRPRRRCKEKIMPRKHDKTQRQKEKRWQDMWERWENGELPSPYAEMLTYDRDVREGGHLQFFINAELRGANFFALMRALKQALPACHARNAAEAYRQYCALAIDIADDAAIVQALDDAPLSAFDDFYDAHEEEMIDALEACADAL